MKHNQSEDMRAYTHTHTHAEEKQEGAWYHYLLVVRSETSPLFQAHTPHNFTKQARTVTYSQDKEVCYSHVNLYHSVLCPCIHLCVLYSSQADSAAYGQGERRGTGQRYGGPAG